MTDFSKRSYKPGNTGDMIGGRMASITIQIGEIIMNTVKVNDQEFEIIEAANDEIETTFVNGQSKEYVSGIGQDKNGNHYEIVWYLDYGGDTLPDDAESWVEDWDTANEANLMSDGFN